MSGTTRVSRYQKDKTRKVKTNLDLLEQEIDSMWNDDKQRIRRLHIQLPIYTDIYSTVQLSSKARIKNKSNNIRKVYY